MIQRMEERINLVKEEVERRGASWREVGFMLSGTMEGEGEGAEGKTNGDAIMTNGISGDEALVNEHGDGSEGRREGAEGGAHSAWTDGTFQTGTISGGVVTMNQTAGQGQQRQGGTLGDEELRRRLEERMRADEADEDGGMHL